MQFKIEDENELTFYIAYRIYLDVHWGYLAEDLRYDTDSHN